jgi:hypothetical protein
VIELLSATDSLAKTQQKMRRWIENGAKLGWLVDPYAHFAHVYESGKEPVTVSVSGTGPVEDLFSILTKSGDATKCSVHVGCAEKVTPPIAWLLCFAESQDVRDYVTVPIL